LAAEAPSGSMQIEDLFLSKMKKSVSSPVGLETTRDGSRYEILAPFDVWAVM
jgi:hypothetical protein